MKKLLVVFATAAIFAVGCNPGTPQSSKKSTGTVPTGSAKPAGDTGPDLGEPMAPEKKSEALKKP